MSSVSGSMIIADDVRREVSGKFIIVGAYTNDIIIPLEQFIVSQLSIVFSIEGDHTDRQPLISFETTFPGEETKSTNVTLNWPETPASEVPSERTRWTLKYFVALGLITLREGPIRATIVYGDQKIPLTPFWIRYVAPSVEEVVS